MSPEVDIERRIAVAFIQAAETAGWGGRVPVKAVADAYNRGRPVRERLNVLQIGRLLNKIGVGPSTRMPDGRRGRWFDQALLDELRRRYLVAEDHVHPRPPVAGPEVGGDDDGALPRAGPGEARPGPEIQGAAAG